VCKKTEDWCLRILDLTAELSLDVVFRDTHIGTRIEAPAYIFSGGKGIEQFGLDSFITEAVLLDLRNKKAGEPIDDEDLEAAEERAGLALREGETVILYTGWGNALRDVSVPAGYPYLSENGAEFLEFKRPFMVGIDAPSLDPQGRKGYPAHSILMRTEILTLESLCNLEKIQQSRFRLMALPLRISGPTSHVRAVAILES
jgi:arylformamidase